MITDIIEYRQNHPTLTLQAIGTHFNVTRSYIHKVLKRNNIPTKASAEKNLVLAVHVDNFIINVIDIVPQNAISNINI